MLALNQLLPQEQVCFRVPYLCAMASQYYCLGDELCSKGHVPVLSHYTLSLVAQSVTHIVPLNRHNFTRWRIKLVRSFQYRWFFITVFFCEEGFWVTIETSSQYCKLLAQMDEGHCVRYFGQEILILVCALLASVTKITMQACRDTHGSLTQYVVDRSYSTVHSHSVPLHLTSKTRKTEISDNVTFTLTKKLLTMQRLVLN